MSSDQDQLPSEDGFTRLVREARQQMQNARNLYWREKNSGNGSVSWDVRELLARRAAQYYDILWEFKDNKQTVEQAWDASDVEVINRLSTETKSVEVEAPGDTSNTKEVQKPALAAISPQRLVELTKQLDTLANELGFAARTESEREFGQIGSQELWDGDDDE